MSSPAHKMPPRPWAAIIITVAALVTLIAVVWRVDTAPSTDDAYAYADTIAVVPQVSGRIVTLAVTDNQVVHKGDLLFQIDPRPFETELQKARAALTQLDAQIPLTQRTVDAQAYNAAAARSSVDRASAAAQQAEDTLRRMEPLVGKGYVSVEDLDRARTSAKSAEAELAAARSQALQAHAAISSVDALVAQRAVVLAEIAAAQLNLEYATVHAPFDGRVVSLTTTTGQYASPAKPVFTLIDTRHWYVLANFRETELDRIREGTPAAVYLLSKPAIHFRGVVDSIGYGVAPEDGTSVSGGLPQIARSINWVHVAQRFPVKIRIEDPDGNVFRVGTSAVATIRPHDVAVQERP